MINTPWIFINVDNTLKQSLADSFKIKSNQYHSIDITEINNNQIIQKNSQILFIVKAEPADYKQLHKTLSQPHRQDIVCILCNAEDTSPWHQNNSWYSKTKTLHLNISEYKNNEAIKSYLEKQILEHTQKQPSQKPSTKITNNISKTIAIEENNIYPLGIAEKELYLNSPTAAVIVDANTNIIIKSNNNFREIIKKFKLKNSKTWNDFISQFNVSEINFKSFIIENRSKKQQIWQVFQQHCSDTLYHLYYLQNITDSHWRKKLQQQNQKLNDALRQLEAIEQTSKELIFRLNLNGNIIHINNEAKKQLFDNNFATSCKFIDLLNKNTQINFNIAIPKITNYNQKTQRIEAQFKSIPDTTYELDIYTTPSVENSSHTEIHIMARNISDKKAEEKLAKQRQAQLERLSKSILVENTVSGMAHQINQPLAIMSTQVQRYAKKYKNDSELSLIFSELSKYTFKIGKLIHHFNNLNNHDKLAELSSIYHHELPELILNDYSELNINWQTYCDNNVSSPSALDKKLNIDLVGFYELFKNLITNSLEAKPEKISITINSYQYDNKLEIHYYDNGPGIPEHLRKTIMEPFFSTKPTGTGIGLALILNLVERWGGNIEARPSEKGAYFFISLVA